MSPNGIVIGASNGIVIGASDVLNVGSLTLAAPIQSSYDDFKKAHKGNNLNSYTPGSDKYKEVLSSANGNITINGKVMAKENVELHGKNITVEGQSNNRAGIIAGVNNQNKLTTQKQEPTTSSCFCVVQQTVVKLFISNTGFSFINISL